MNNIEDLLNMDATSLQTLANEYNTNQDTLSQFNNGSLQRILAAGQAGKFEIVIDAWDITQQGITYLKSKGFSVVREKRTGYTFDGFGSMFKYDGGYIISWEQITPP